MKKQFTQTQIECDPIIKGQLKFSVALKTLQTEGNLVYEYNPLRNYRVTELSYQYKGQIYSPKELYIELYGKDTIEVDGKTKDITNDLALSLFGSKGYKWVVPADQTDPILLEPGELTDFVTKELNFDINHPVDILPQYSYDNSVNLIINDDKNIPRLINSRFSATEKNKYQIVDRKGDNDTNIYDQGAQFDIDTSLYKRVTEIPKIKFNGVTDGGKLPVGNYHFYFKYSDADGNETDFVAESGLVSVFIGNTQFSCNTGFRNENSHKSVQFTLSNIDSAYQYVTVYYTRSASDILENASVSAHRIDQKYVVNNLLKCNILVTGYEHTTEITLAEINPQYQIASAIGTQAQCQNMLFIGNLQKPNIPYKELQDISLRFLPVINSSETYPLEIDKDYNITSSSKGYYDPNYIYNKVGYWNHELYRLGIVYILADNTLSPVFNIRGTNKLSTKLDNYTFIKFKDDKGERKYITVEENTYRIINENNKGSVPQAQLENSLGVISIETSLDGKQKVLGLDIVAQKEAIEYLTNTLKIKGFFFVRQKRIPTILCQAYTIGIDKASYVPLLPVKDNQFVAESFIDKDKMFTHNFEDRLYNVESDLVRVEGAICPEYDVDYPYYNSLFTGDSFTVTDSDIQPSNQYLENSNRNYYIPEYIAAEDSNAQYTTKIVALQDNTKLVSIDQKFFSGRAGEAEEAWKFEYLGTENKITEATNLVRGIYGPYLGITGYPTAGKLIDIRVPGFASTSESELFTMRYNDKSPYYAISDRIALKDIDDWFIDYSLKNTDIKHMKLVNPLYRGDCYICQFTHRLNRNFQDPSAPTNDKIVDPKGWKENFEIDNGTIKIEKFEKINLGDVNAIKLGMWVTFTVRSTKNLNIRSFDSSHVDETALFGHPRGFYPQYPITAEGIYKTEEALCYNKGFEKSVSERYNFEIPDVPALKNDLSNRIAYSDISINDAFKNGFRVFQLSHYRDYPKTYGSITKIVEFRNNLICVFEHGVALISVNERALAGEGSGGFVYINTSNVLPENLKVISDTFGSQWKDSIIKTPNAVYGVDTVARKIWRTNGNVFECISDFKVQEFLNNNISLTERELEPIIGVRNVKTHYNKFKEDVLFTFYDNLYGFEEKVWNLCYNESLHKWITFYSWVPSYSENISNQFFTFDRNTSKWITKLGLSNENSDFKDGVVLSNNIIPYHKTTFEPVLQSTSDQITAPSSWTEIGKLNLANRQIPKGDGISGYSIKYELEKDNYGNYNRFYIEPSNGVLYLKAPYEQVCSELYKRELNGKIIDPNIDETAWINTLKDHSAKVLKDDYGRKVMLDKPYNSDQIVYLLNIKATITLEYDGDFKTLAEAYTQGFKNIQRVDAGYYQSVVAVIPEYNQQFLTTDFWKHGQAGIIDIADKIYPTYWYGKQHPFEFEFVVADKPQLHKIFDDLEIISNKAEPESFHYEIVGECYDFAKDKKNMYIRQEATKELYQNNGFDVLYDRNYDELESKHRGLRFDKDNNPILYDKSTLFPLYYSRRDSSNEIEDFYHLKDDVKSKDFSALAGAEIVRYKNLDEYRIWNHARAINLNNSDRLRGNMQYKEDKWNVQINPLNIVERNEPEWKDLDGKTTTKVPVELGQSPIPNEVLTDENGDAKTNLKIPDSFKTTTTQEGRGYVVWKWEESKMKEAKLKDKFMKVRIRYSGKNLAIISAIRTLYSASYS